MDEMNKTNSEDSLLKGKKVHIPLSEWVSKFRLSFSNAKGATFQQKLAPMGYNEEKLNTLLEQLKELESQILLQKKRYAEQYSATEAFKQKMNEVFKEYSDHYSLCKVFFKKNVTAISVLELSGLRKIGYGEQSQQIANFYAQLLDNPELLEAVKAINIKREDLEAVQNKLVEVSELKEAQKRCIAQAQKATEERDKTFDELYSQYADFIAYSKIIFKQVQDLEALGITVKRK